MYSFGLLLYEMCIRQLPDWIPSDPEWILAQMGLVTYGLLPHLIIPCVERAPDARPNMNDVIRVLRDYA